MSIAQHIRMPDTKPIFKLKEKINLDALLEEPVYRKKLTVSSVPARVVPKSIPPVDAPKSSQISTILLIGSIVVIAGVTLYVVYNL